MKYNPLKKFSNIEIQDILESSSNIQDARVLPLSVGEYCDNWETAQDICIRLINHIDDEVRANAILGLSYIARRYHILDRNIIEPLLKKELKRNINCRDRVLYAIEDIYLFLKW